MCRSTSGVIIQYLICLRINLEYFSLHVTMLIIHVYGMKWLQAPLPRGLCPRMHPSIYTESNNPCFQCSAEQYVHLPPHRLEFARELRLRCFRICVGSDGVEFNLRSHVPEEVADLGHISSQNNKGQRKEFFVPVEHATCHRQSQTTRGARPGRLCRAPCTGWP